MHYILLIDINIKQKLCTINPFPMCSANSGIKLLWSLTSMWVLQGQKMFCMSLLSKIFLYFLYFFKQFNFLDNLNYFNKIAFSVGINQPFLFSKKIVIIVFEIDKEINTAYPWPEPKVFQLVCSMFTNVYIYYNTA